MIENKLDLPKNENKEGLRITTEIINYDDLFDIIYNIKSTPLDERFLRTEDGGVFKYFDIKEFAENRDRKFFPVVKVGDKIVGLSELLKDPLNNKNLWIQFLSVDPKEQNKGYASMLVKEIFEFAKYNGYSLESSSYKEKGYEKLRPVFLKLAKEYSVKFIDKEKLLPKT